MKALITGASSGIGRDMARVLSRRGYDLILVARRRDRLEELARELPVNVRIICLDLSDEKSCRELHDLTAEEKIDILINNAGFGLFGTLQETDLEKELDLIDLNIRAVHILTKLFLKDFMKRDSGYLLNVASSAAFLPGPLMSSYYASKSYVFRLTEAIYEELRRSGSRVSVSVLCPGPVKTEFEKTADVNFTIQKLESSRVAEYAIDRMLRRKLVIIPGAIMKTARFFERFLPEKALLRAAWHMQERNMNGD